MTPTQYQAGLDELLRFVGHLLTCPAGSPEWEVGRTFALASDSERLRYVADLIASTGERSRLHEIGWDLRAILLGWPESEVAA